ncbi:hypothetical protein CHUAL_004278 [Chamberlinius hualienensis]
MVRVARSAFRRTREKGGGGNWGPSQGSNPGMVRSTRRWLWVALSWRVFVGVLTGLCGFAGFEGLVAWRAWFIPASLLRSLPSFLLGCLTYSVPPLARSGY